MSMKPMRTLESVLKHNKVPLTFSVVIYFFTLMIGALLFYFLNPDMSNLETFRPKCGFQGEPTTLTIIQNNGLMIAILISGSFLLGLTTFINLVLNGFTFGIAISGVIQTAAPLTTILLIIIPHAIFELPAIWIAGAAGFKIPYELIQYFRGKKDYILNREELTDFLLLSAIALVLIITAAIVEGEVTMRIADMISG